jgi:acyl-CoA synthetase (AMP-forming)/AMP-acid ligase II
LGAFRLSPRPSAKSAKWQLPDAFVFLDELPHTSTGKLSKLELRKRFADWQWSKAQPEVQQS